MSISGISGQAATVSTNLGTAGAASSGSPFAALTAVASGSAEGGLVANINVDESVVSTALQDLNSALGSIIDITV